LATFLLIFVIYGSHCDHLLKLCNEELDDLLVYIFPIILRGDRDKMGKTWSTYGKIGKYM